MFYTAGSIIAGCDSSNYPSGNNCCLSAVLLFCSYMGQLDYMGFACKKVFPLAYLHCLAVFLCAIVLGVGNLGDPAHDANIRTRLKKRKNSETSAFT